MNRFSESVEVNHSTRTVHPPRCRHYNSDCRRHNPHWEVCCWTGPGYTTLRKKWRLVSHPVFSWNTELLDLSIYFYYSFAAVSCHCCLSRWSPRSYPSSSLSWQPLPSSPTPVSTGHAGKTSTTSTTIPLTEQVCLCTEHASKRALAVLITLFFPCPSPPPSPPLLSSPSPPLPFSPPPPPLPPLPLLSSPFSCFSPPSLLSHRDPSAAGVLCTHISHFSSGLPPHLPP